MLMTTKRSPTKHGRAPIFTAAEVAEIEDRAWKDLAAIQAVTAALSRTKPCRTPAAKGA